MFSKRDYRYAMTALHRKVKARTLGEPKAKGVCCAASPHKRAMPIADEVS